MVSKGKSVLIIIVGGNVCLVAAQGDRMEASTILRPANISDFRRWVLGGPKVETLLTRESDIKGQELRLDFMELRKDPHSKAVNPEDLDSSQVNPELWQAIADKISDSYRDHEGFVVLHGLDTMAYTASALSFMLGSLRVPVVFVGSQRPLNYLRTDAVQNIRSAIAVAGMAAQDLGPAIPEVMVFSHDTLYRANRSTMVHASSYRAFDSPNYPTLASFGEHIEIQFNLVRPPSKINQITLKRDVSGSVSILDVFPGMDPKVIETLAKSKSLKGLLLRTYGMGTAPTNQKILQALEKVIKANIVVMNVTQARGGRISHGQDPVSLRLFEQGVISGVDMTAEAAYGKMVIVLSQMKDQDNGENAPEDLREKAEDQLQISFCGEQSQSILHFHYYQAQTELCNTGDYRADLSPKRPMEMRHLLEGNEDKITHAQLRLLGVEPVSDAPGIRNRIIDFDAKLVNRFRHDESEKVLTKTILRWKGEGKRTINMAYNITEAVYQLLNPDTRLRIDTIEPIKWKRLTIAIFADVSL